MLTARPSTARKSVTRSKAINAFGGEAEAKECLRAETGTVSIDTGASYGRREATYAYQAAAGQASRQTRRRDRNKLLLATCAAQSSKPVSRVRAARIAIIQTRSQRSSSQYSRNPANRAVSGPSTSMRSKEANVAGTTTNRSPQNGERPARQQTGAQYPPNPRKSISTPMYATSIEAGCPNANSQAASGTEAVENGVAANPRSGSVFLRGTESLTSFMLVAIETMSRPLVGGP